MYDLGLTQLLMASIFHNIMMISWALSIPDPDNVALADHLSGWADVSNWRAKSLKA
jgi:hypothetical protein